MAERQNLQLPDDLNPEDFQPRTRRDRPNPQDIRQTVDEVARFPRREAGDEFTQLNIRIRRDVADRFKRICEDDRRSYAAMLEILMDKAGL